MDADVLDDDFLKDMIDITNEPHNAGAATTIATTNTATTSVGDADTASFSTMGTKLAPMCGRTDIPKQSDKTPDLGVNIARPPPLPASLLKMQTSALVPPPERQNLAPSPLQKFPQISPLERVVALDSPLALGAHDSSILDLDANSPNLPHGNNAVPTGSVERDRLDSVDLTLSDDDFEAGLSKNQKLWTHRATAFSFKLLICFPYFAPLFLIQQTWAGMMCPRNSNYSAQGTKWCLLSPGVKARCTFHFRGHGNPNHRVAQLQQASPGRRARENTCGEFSACTATESATTTISSVSPNADTTKPNSGEVPLGLWPLDDCLCASAAIFLSARVFFFAVAQPGIADVKLQSEKEANVKPSSKLDIAKEVSTFCGCEKL